MALVTSNSGNSGEQKDPKMASNFEAPPTASTKRPHPKDGNARFSVGFAADHNRQFMSAKPGGGETAGWAEKLNDVYKSRQQHFDIRVITLDNSVIENLAYSVINVCVASRDNASEVAVYPMLLEATGELPKNIDSININTQSSFMAQNQRPLELPRMPTDAFDSVIDKYIIDELTKVYGPNHNFKMIDGCVIPAEVNYNNEDEVIAVAANAGNSCHSELLITHEDFTDLNIRAEVGKLSTGLTTEVKIGSGIVLDEVHRPLAHDFVVELNIDPERQYGARSVHLDNSATTIVRVWGMLDFIPMTAPGDQMNPARTIYRPHIILTNISTQYKTPGYALLGLITGSIIRNNDIWIAILSSIIGSQDKLRNPGALNILTQLNGTPDKIDFNNSDINSMEFNQIIRGMIRTNEVIVSIDVAHGGPQSYFTSIFSAAGYGKHRQDGSNSLIAAANQLTSGAFGQYYQGHAAPVKYVTQIPGGIWFDANSRPRDLREIDMMAVAEQLGKDNFNDISDFAVATLQSAPDQFQAINRRLEILRKVVPNAIVTNWIFRCVIDKDFLLASEVAATEAGLSSNLNAPSIYAGIGNLNSVGDFMGDMAVGSGTMFARAIGSNYSGSTVWNAPGANRSFRF